MQRAVLPWNVTGDMTLLDLILVVQEFTRSDAETVEVISALLDSGRIRLRLPETCPELAPAGVSRSA